MSQFRLARLCLMLAALGVAPGLVTNAFAQKDDKAAAAAAAPQVNTVRPELAKLFDPAVLKQQLDAKNYADVQSRIAQAEALPNPTPYESYVIERTKLGLAAAKGDGTAIVASMSALLNSSFLSADEKDHFMILLGNQYYTDKNYPKAIEVYKRYQKEGKNPAEVRDALIRAEYFSGDYASAKNDLLPVVLEEEKAGKAPSETNLKLLASAANKVKDEATYSMALDKFVTYYPSDEFWTDAINRGVLRKPGYDAQANDMNTFRLMNSAIQKLPADDYISFAEYMLQQGFPTEAKKMVDTAFSNGVLTASNAKARQLRDKANKAAAEDAKNITAVDASTAKSKNGAGLVNQGWAYSTMGQYDKGIDFIRQGIAKGGLKHPDEAKLRLGIAQFRAGHKDEALKTLQEVKAGGGLSDIARYWIILVNHPTPATEAAK
jgi:hypothetical protein